MAKPSRFSTETYQEYKKNGYWNTTTFSELWDANAQHYPDKEAVVDSRNRITWAQAKLLTDRLALGFLELGFKKDDMLIVQLPNSVDLTVLRIAAEKAGLLCLPVLRTLRHREIEYIVSYTGAIGIVVLWEFRGFNYIDMLKDIKPRLRTLKYIFVAGDKVPKDTISIHEMVEKPVENKYTPDYLKDRNMPWNEFSTVAFTSGTTGSPKFVEQAICSTIGQGAAAVQGDSITKDDIVFTLSPAAFGPSIIAYLCAPIVGATIIMEEHFEAEEALRIIEEEKVTVIGAVPAQLTMMAAHPDFHKYNLSSLRLIHCTGSPLAYHIGVDVEAKMNAKLIQCYGAVDFGMISSSTFSDPQEVRLLTTGRPYPGHEVRLVSDYGEDVPRGEIGEVWARGPYSVSGYFKDIEATREVWGEGWYKTGDLGKFTEEGNLMVVGRKKDMIIRGGQNIYPAEIEALLVTHPRVLTVAIVGLPDTVLGERACACVVPKGEQIISFEEMESFLKSKEIAPFKIPERLEIVDKLPMIADGQKIDKKLLTREIIEKLTTEENR